MALAIAHLREQQRRTLRRARLRPTRLACARAALNARRGVDIPPRGTIGVACAALGLDGAAVGEPAHAALHRAGGAVHPLRLAPLRLRLPRLPLGRLPREALGHQAT
eukprot:5755726-Prymnesium_polylepis.2